MTEQQRVEWQSENKVWSFIEIRSKRLWPSRRRGWVINNSNGKRYVWSVGEDKNIRFMEQVREPKLPKYLTEEILNDRGHEEGKSSRTEQRCGGGIV